ncbi:hypothetical protein ACIGZJ_31060 [Kitasatospora sp. NPDC052868]|uniref:hypothetical protein n=1 Tax=Kitasatospora sp. NPDC052868 TaxID=3364060 RepID=UPI0037C8B7B9
MSDHNINGGYGNKPIPTPPPQPPKASAAPFLPPEHPALADAHRAVHALHTLTATGPADAALLLLGIAGDGTGGPSIAETLARVLVRLADQAAAHLEPAAADEVAYAARLAQIALTGIAGDHLAPAITHLEQTPAPTGRTTAARALTLAGAR